MSGNGQTPRITEVAAPTDAGRLVGMELPDGWKVVERLKLGKGSGGNFSVPYLVRREAQEAFMKAIDLARVLRGRNTIDQAQAITSAFQFERDLLVECTEANLSRVVRLLGYGEVPAASLPGDAAVPYLILEKAEGDVRRHLLSTSMQIDVAFALRALHHIAVGLRQMHGKGIAHHDIKPSNILYFGRDEGSKIGDVGAASRRGARPGDGASMWTGDLQYMPPEHLYGYISADWDQRSRACDLYLLGSMATFFICGEGMTSLLLGHLHDEHHHARWGGTFEGALPYLQHAFSEVLRTVHDSATPEVRDELTESVRQQCEPDPARRGHPANRTGVESQYSVVRYVSLYDRLAKSAEMALRSGRSG